MSPSSPQSHGFTHAYDNRELPSRKQRITTLVVINEYPDCPVCGNELGFAFHTVRKLKTYGGVSRNYVIPVCRCGDENCSFGFVRILPDIMTPHKHYSTEVIENVVDEVCTSETLQTEDYPCELTMTRWKAWIAGNINHVDGVLKSIGSRLSEFGTELLNSKVSLVEQLRKDGEGWLAVMNRITWNFGMPFLNTRQLRSVSTDLFSVSDNDVLTFLCKEANIRGEQKSNRLAGKYSSDAVSDHSAASGSDP